MFIWYYFGNKQITYFHDTGSLFNTLLNTWNLSSHWIIWMLHVIYQFEKHNLNLRHCGFKQTRLMHGLWMDFKSFRCHCQKTSMRLDILEAHPLLMKNTCILNIQWVMAIIFANKQRIWKRYIKQILGITFHVFI